MFFRRHSFVCTINRKKINAINSREDDNTVCMQHSLPLQNVQLNFSSKTTISKEQQDPQDIKDWAHLLQVSSKVVFTAQNLGSFRSQGLSILQDPLAHAFFATASALCWRPTSPYAFQSDTQSRECITGQTSVPLMPVKCWNVEPPKAARKTGRGRKYGWNLNNYGLAKQSLTGKQWLSATSRKQKQGKSLEKHKNTLLWSEPECIPA